MMSRKEDLINFWERAIFVVLFLFLISSFYDKSLAHENRSIHYASISLLDTSTISAVSVDAIQLPLFEKSWVSLIDKSNFIFFNEDLKIFADSNKITLRITSLQKTQRLIKSTIHCGFYDHLFPIDNDELPVLS
jgi:hypothetical protein